MEGLEELIVVEGPEELAEELVVDEDVVDEDDVEELDDVDIVDEVVVLEIFVLLDVDDRTEAVLIWFWL